MSFEMVRKIGQVWKKCPYEWGLEKYVTVMTENCGRIILMDVEEFRSDTNDGVRYTEVMSIDLDSWKGESKENPDDNN